jgi:hypothetical protein
MVVFRFLVATASSHVRGSVSMSSSQGILSPRNNCACLETCSSSVNYVEIIYESAFLELHRFVLQTSSASSLAFLPHQPKIAEISTEKNLPIQLLYVLPVVPATLMKRFRSIRMCQNFKKSFPQNHCNRTPCEWKSQSPEFIWVN